MKQFIKKHDRNIIGVLSCVEPCRSYDIAKNREPKHIELAQRLRKCLHWYLYFLNPQGPKKLRRLRKGVADLPRRSQISQASNSRYLTALAAADGMSGGCDRWSGVSRRASLQGLSLLSSPDARVLEILLRGEFAVNGFRNRDVREKLFGSTRREDERRRQSGQVSRLLRLFREHGLIRKVKGTHRYHLTAKGQRTLPAFIAA